MPSCWSERLGIRGQKSVGTCRLAGSRRTREPAGAAKRRNRREPEPTEESMTMVGLEKIL